MASAITFTDDAQSWSALTFHVSRCTFHRLVFVTRPVLEVFIRTSNSKNLKHIFSFESTEIYLSNTKTTFTCTSNPNSSVIFAYITLQAHADRFLRKNGKNAVCVAKLSNLNWFDINYWVFQLCMLLSIALIIQKSFIHLNLLIIEFKYYWNFTLPALVV